MSLPSVSTGAPCSTRSCAWHWLQPASAFSFLKSGWSQNLFSPCAFSTEVVARPFPQWQEEQPNFSGSWICKSSRSGWLTKARASASGRLARAEVARLAAVDDLVAVDVDLLHPEVVGLEALQRPLHLLPCGLGDVVLQVVVALLQEVARRLQELALLG